MTVDIGDRLPNVVLCDAHDQHVALRALAGSPMLLVFLRHLGCLPCREHLLEIITHRDRLGVRVACITFSAPQLLAGFRREMDLDDDVLLLADPQRLAYRTFGFERGSIARVWLHPRVWLRYAQLLKAGRRPVPVHQDTLQLGGDILIDVAGQITWIYRSRGPDDRPSISQIAAITAITAACT